MTTTLKLAQPIQAHGEEQSELSFREPNGKDIRLTGVPFTILDGGDGKAETKFDAVVVAKYISLLASIPTSSVDQFAAQDWLAAMAIVTGFFGAAAPSS